MELLPALYCYTVFEASKTSNIMPHDGGSVVLSARFIGDMHIVEYFNELLFHEELRFDEYCLKQYVESSEDLSRTMFWLWNNRRSENVSD